MWRHQHKLQFAHERYISLTCAYVHTPCSLNASTITAHIVHPNPNIAHKKLKQETPPSPDFLWLQGSPPRQVEFRRGDSYRITVSSTVTVFEERARFVGLSGKGMSFPKMPCHQKHHGCFWLVRVLVNLSWSILPLPSRTVQRAATLTWRQCSFHV